jgi:TolA-binding protein
MTMNRTSSPFSRITICLILAGLSSCAGRMAHPDQDKNEFQPTAVGQPTPVDTGKPGAQSSPQMDTRASQLGMNARLDVLEKKIADMNDKLDATRSALDNFLTAHAPKSNGVSNSPTDVAGTPLADTEQTSAAVASGFVRDGAVQLYRKANILFESQKYPEANLAYADFLERYPDHALAGGAQFHIGEGYFNQHQYKEAVEEFKKVLTSYDRSSAVPATLRDLIEAEENIGKNEQSDRYRQLLLSLFPNSPAAQNLSARAETPAAPMTPTTPMNLPASGPAVNTPPDSASAPHRDLDMPPPTAPAPGGLNTQ